MPEVAHEIEYQLPVTLTSSLNVIDTFAVAATPVAPAAGVVEATFGAFSASQKCTALAVVRGVGAAAVKSAPLSSVSAQPSAFRIAAVVFVSVGAAAAPSKKFAFP